MSRVSMCATCLTAPREPGSAKCADCWPGRLFDPRALTPRLDAAPPADHARALVLDADEDGAVQGSDRPRPAHGGEKCSTTGALTPFLSSQASLPPTTFPNSGNTRR